MNIKSVLVLLLLVNSCKQSSEASFYKMIEPRANIKALLDSFVVVNGNRNLEYALYIDKISPHEYNLIVYTGNESLTGQEDQVNNQYPINMVRTSNVEFKVYSGIEHYFRMGNQEVKKQSDVKRSDCVIWVAKDSAGVFTVYESLGAYPFIAPPDILSDSITLNLPYGLH